MIGGYTLVDGTGAVLSTGGTVTGLYKKLTDAIATKKPVILEHVKYATVEYTPFNVVLTPDTGIVYLDTPMGAYSVTSADVLAAVETLGETKKGGKKS